MFKFDNKKFFRDKLSFFLLIVCYSLIIFSVANLSILYTRYKESKDVLYRYSCYSKGVIYQITPFENVWSKEFFDTLLSRVEKIDSDIKEVVVYDSVNDISENTGLVLDYSSNYMDDMDILYENRKNIPGVYIGADVSGTINSNGKKYIIFNQNSYLVKGIYKQLIDSGRNKQIVFPMELFSPTASKIIKDGAFVSSLKNQSVSYYIATNNNIENEIRDFLSDYEKNENLEIDLTAIEEIDDFYGLGDIQVIGAYVIVIFSLLCGVSVFSLWIKRISKEISIRKIWGASNLNILGNMVLYILKILLLSIPIAFIFIIFGKLLSEESIYGFKYILLCVMFSGLGLLCLSFILFLYFMIYISVKKHFKGAD
ncbi:MAG: hypothetical protein IKS48_05805 [Eubacterium sp.]|nr:hypothetical protein [Eubacterium sp.]